MALLKDEILQIRVAEPNGIITILTETSDKLPFLRSEKIQPKRCQMAEYFSACLF